MKALLARILAQVRALSARVLTQQVKRRLVIAFFWIAAFGCGWLGWSEVHPLFQAITQRDPTINFWPRGVQALPLSVMFFALAGTELFPRPEWASGKPTRRRRKSDPPPSKFDPVSALLLLAFACVPFVVVLPLVMGVSVDFYLAEHGYRSCPTPRTGPLQERWALLSTPCPKV